jgi:tRNA threonylcarbamoyladenosine biosynthesis protein TsaE
MEQTTINTFTQDEEETKALADIIGARLRGGEVIELVGDLGAGKTAFVKGLVRGAGGKGRVYSPTFTISNLYECDKFEVHHFDFYRLAEAGVVGFELEESVGRDDVVVVVEWGNTVKDVLPDDRLKVLLSATAEDGRSLKINHVALSSYLVEGIQER